MPEITGKTINIIILELVKFVKNVNGGIHIEEEAALEEGALKQALK